MQSITIRNQQFSLHGSGALFWPEKNMLLIADVHFGKVAHFRKYGAAIPTSASKSNFTKLQQVVSETNPKTICFLGDLFHSVMNNEFLAFQQWAETSTAKLILVAGNHDIISPHEFEALGMTVVEELQMDGLILTHHPTDSDTHFNISGHIHPGVRLQGPARQMTKLPCFFKRRNQLILPAFGSFTGKYILKPTEEDEVFVIVEDEVVKVS
ncbi:MAG: metallophosphoesterase [Flavobacteriaceae bacterium]|nr:metallophosphoesterase [Flavobacteriaceae bacterium]